MKKIALGLLFAAVLCGCSSTYDIRLSDSSVVTSKGKPKLDQQHNRWIFVDGFGHTNTIPAGRVVEVTPQSMERKSF